MIIVFIDVTIILIGLLYIFLTVLVGGLIDYVFDALPEYIGSFFVILFILQILKHLYLYNTQIKSDTTKKTALLTSCAVNLIAESVRCLILSVFLCNWLSSYNSDSVYEMLISGITFILDVCIYGLLVLATESISWYQGQVLEDKDYSFFAVIGCVNALVLFFVINFTTDGLLLDAVQIYLTSVF